jgi:hypothetical protein
MNVALFLYQQVYEYVGARKLQRLQRESLTGMTGD